MARIRSRRNPHSAVTLAALVAATLPLAVHAADEEKPRVLPKVSVEAAEEVPFLATESANPKFTQPLLDTPQTVQVIKKELLREQGAASLMEALRNTPGITMQLGENGNTSAGDAFTMRGFATNTSTFIDGIRDLGAITRDTFNLEQVEIAKGPAGTDIGRGAASGYINLISKLPTRDGVNMLTAGVGTASKLRATADLNQAIGETSAIRLNAMVSDGDVDKRDVVENQSYAIAPSFATGLGTPTRFYLFSQHVRQDNVPDGGISALGFKGLYIAPSYSTTVGSVTTVTQNAATEALASAIMNAPKVNRSNYYGSTGDYEDVSADMVTAKFEHDLDSKTTIRNTSRYGKTSMDRVMNGTTLPSVSANALNPANPAYLDPNDPSSWTFTPNRQRVDRANEILANQTTLNTEFSTGAVKHTFAGGLEFMWERQKSLSFGTTAQTINGVAYAATVNPPTSFYNPDPSVVRSMPYATGAYTDGETTTAALYAFDTMELTPAWLLSAGVRLDHYNTHTDSASVSGGVLVPSSLEDSGNLFSWKVGAVYKPATNGSIYAAYATSLTPPGSADLALSGTANNQNNGALDPQETKNVEVGTKWNLLNDRLSLSAALFRTENSKQTSFDSFTLQPVQIGRTRVQGAEIAAVGQINNFWQVSAGVTKLDAKALEQRSSTGTETTGIRWTPDLSATLWTSYTLGNLTLGGGARYVSEQKRTVTVVTAPQNGLDEIPSYWAADAMIAYKVSKQLNMRLNVYNLFDEEYIETMNNGGNRVRLGLPRSAMLTAEFTF